METGQHPQLLPISVVTETDLTPVNQSAEESQRQQRWTVTSCCGSNQLLDSLSVSSGGGTPEGFGGKPLDLPPTQLFGHDGTLTLLELQQSLRWVSRRQLFLLLKSVCFSQHVSCSYLLCLWTLRWWMSEWKVWPNCFHQRKKNSSSPRSRFPEGFLKTPAGRASVCPAHVFCADQSHLSKQHFTVCLLCEDETVCFAENQTFYKTLKTVSTLKTLMNVL